MEIYERNKIIEQHLWCIDCVIHQNMALIAGAHLDREDVYQALAERMIRVVSRYDAARGRSLKGYICDQLRFELLTCASPKAKYGFVGAPYRIPDIVISMESYVKSNLYGESMAAV